jgi:predicted nucleic acid-binding Zn ribbon protein
MLERFRKMTRVKSIGSVFSELFKELGIDKAIEQNKAVVDWAEIVGERIAEVSQAEKIEKGTLIVKVESPVWRNELSFMKQNLIEDLNKKLKKNIVKDIKFT